MKALVLTLAVLGLGQFAVAGDNAHQDKYEGKYKYQCKYVPEVCEADDNGQICYGGYMKCQNVKAGSPDWMDKEPKGGK